MNWPATLGVGALTAVSACLLAGWIANLSVGWYRISSFEGASGYYVVAIALLGAAFGLVTGIITARMLGDGAFLRALGAAHGVVLLLALGIGGVARLLADVPPRHHGDELLLAVELRWPEGQDPRTLPDTTEWHVRLSALRGRTVRARRAGPLWREDARREEGRWVVPGAVEIFTSRGDRMLTVGPDDFLGEGFLVPLPGRPGRGELAWSPWLPEREGNRFQYRFRVVPTSQPIRVETAGPFEVTTIASGFSVGSGDGGAMRWSAAAHFEVRHRGEVVRIRHQDASSDTTIEFTRMDAVALVGGAPVLLVQVGEARGEGECYLLRDEAGVLKAEWVATCGDGVRAPPITEDPERYARAAARPRLEGRVDRLTYAETGPYLFRDAVLDTRTLTVRRFQPSGLGGIIARIPPLGMAPDGLSYVRLAWAGGGDSTGLVVVDLAGEDPRELSIDRSRMRYAEIDQVDPAWLAHHFAWRQDAGGRDRLVPREGITPRPHRGILTLDGTGYREYRLSPAREGLREALMAWLVETFQAEVVSADAGAFAHEVRIAGALVHVSFRAEDGHVGVWMDRGQDTGLVATIAERFDAALGSGRFDRHFGP